MRQLLIILAALALLPLPDLLAADIATKKVAKEAVKAFDAEYRSPGVDQRVAAIEKVASCVHKDVVKRLLKALKRDPVTDVRIAAAKALAGQKPYARVIGQQLKPLLTDVKSQPELLVPIVKTVGALPCRQLGDVVARLIHHVDDGVVVACFEVLGEWKDLRAHRTILDFWMMYPTEYKWATGAVHRVEGGAEQAWRGKYGGASKRRARPKCVKALRAAVLAMTGEKIMTHQKFKEWCSAHKREIKAAKRVGR